MNLLEKLMNIQSELKAPKSQYNSFGKYNFRNCEDILEAVKPLLKKYKCVLTISSEIVNVDGRFYVKATPTLHDTESNEKITNTAFAREANDKKGMDEAQITGGCVAYSSKYALNGLFCIDDTKDADSTNNGENNTAVKSVAVKTQPKVNNEAKPQNVCDLSNADEPKIKTKDGWKSVRDLDDATLKKVRKMEVYKDVWSFIDKIQGVVNFEEMGEMQADNEKVPF